MSRKRKVADPKRPAGRSRLRRRPRSRMLAVGSLAAFLAMAVIFFAARRGERGGHPADAMTFEEAAQAGITRGAAGRHLESLPYFRAAVRAAPGVWAARQNVANALYNGAQEARTHLGKDGPVTRSSVERIAMIREALLASRAADSLASEPEDRAMVAYQRGQAFFTFGLPIDALVEFRNAHRLAQANAFYQRTAARSEAELAAGGVE